MVIGLERGADLHMAQLMPLPLTVSYFSKIQIGFTFLIPLTRSSEKRPLNVRARVCVCDCMQSSLLAVYPVISTIIEKTDVNQCCAGL